MTDPARSKSALDEALTKSEHDEQRWWIAELLRIKAELILLAEAQTPPRRPRRTCRTRSHGHAGKARCPWSCDAPPTSPGYGSSKDGPRRPVTSWPIYARFTEGFATADLEAAKALLGSLGVT